MWQLLLDFNPYPVSLIASLGCLISSICLSAWELPPQAEKSHITKGPGDINTISWISQQMTDRGWGINTPAPLPLCGITQCLNLQCFPDCPYGTKLLSPTVVTVLPLYPFRLPSLPWIPGSLSILPFLQNKLLALKSVRDSASEATQPKTGNKEHYYLSKNKIKTSLL